MMPLGCDLDARRQVREVLANPFDDLAFGPFAIEFKEKRTCFREVDDVE